MFTAHYCVLIRTRLPTDMKIKLRAEIFERLKEKGIYLRDFKTGKFDLIDIAKCEKKMKKCNEAYYKNMAKLDPFADNSAAQFKYHGVLFSIVAVFVCFVF